MPRARSTYAAEFKLRDVTMIAAQRLSVAEAARRLDVRANRLREWRKAFLARATTPCPDTAPCHLPKANSGDSGAKSHDSRPNATS